MIFVAFLFYRLGGPTPALKGQMRERVIDEEGEREHRKRERYQRLRRDKGERKRIKAIKNINITCYSNLYIYNFIVACG